jgi:hypothetical protein
MNRTRVGITAGAAVIVTGVVATVALASVGWKHHATSHVRGTIHAVVIDENAGDIHVASESRSDVVVRSTTSWIFHRPHVKQRVENGVLTLSTSGRSFLSGTDYNVTVPDGVDITVRNDAGDISVDAATRHISLEADAGDIRVTVPAGRYAVDTRTDAGETHVRGIVQDDRAPRSISVRTDAGDVHVEAR